MDEEKVTDRILTQTEERIFTDGSINFTMDDIAAEAGVSKKTLYRLIPSRNDLIVSVVGRQIDKVARKQKSILEDTDLVFTEKLNAVIRIVSEILEKVSRQTVRDIARMSPELWELIRQRRMDLLENMTRIIEEGRVAGKLRNDVSSSFIARYFIQMIDAMVSPQVAMEEEMALNDVLENVMHLFFKGVLSPSGKEELE